MILFIKAVVDVKETPGTGKKVKYHVANPEVAGKVVSSPDASGYVNVVFEKPVGFSGNSSRGLHKFWACSSTLLFDTPQEAWANKRY